MFLVKNFNFVPIFFRHKPNLLEMGRSELNPVNIFSASIHAAVKFKPLDWAKESHDVYQSMKMP